MNVVGNVSPDVTDKTPPRLPGWFQRLCTTPIFQAVSGSAKAREPPGLAGVAGVLSGTSALRRSNNWNRSRSWGTLIYIWAEPRTSVLSLGERQMKTYRFDSQNQQQKRRGRAAADCRATCGVVA